eukprot:Protomagalhaensia_wolfi_Nauph_80__5977@NODE_805_length_1984_cov_9_295630_g604_i0_p1_GENE_NODE_805_length_1984_cov_9_295630_g604_i0NODE_805_length_1984_cov_9_295630_g604_i0_p1_ORF_typecomplete_len521_score125_13DcuA_DcuB/PF03605_14/3_6e82DcuA_DcuB/PF03605_14/2_1e39MatC_N/PF07158_11/1_7e05MatC_N/PF07158_11/4_1e03MatC_N/PF07158_11/1_9e03MatC_N/PF07158_11/9e03CitMHS/PF03600_16/0_0072DUF4774/PF15999_5/1_4e02DUF4774/PF15999_5/38DcuC/PF03606_15/0_0054DcuC/PF03606_15/5_1e03_NODE_805_length_1984_cov_9_29
MPTGSIPFDVVSIIMCVIAAIAAMQCAGGMDWLVSLAERAMRKHPKYITILAPIITFLMTLLAGTGHSAFSTLPVIAEVAKVAGVRPARPLTVAVTASQIAIVASPISAAVVAFANHTEAINISYVITLAVMIPSCFLATILTAIICNFLGKDLIDDPIYADRWERGICVGGPVPRMFQGKDIDSLRHSSQSIITDEQTAVVAHQISDVSINALVNKETSDNPVGAAPGKKVYPKAMWGWPAEKVSVAIFCVAILFIVVYAVLISDTVGLAGPDVSLDRNGAILSGMLTAGLVICVVCKNETAKVVQQPTFRTGMTAVVCVIGVAWMGDTFVVYYTPDITRIAGDVLTSQAWLLSVILAIASCLLYSQAVTTNALYPTVVGLGISRIVALGSFPAVSALFILPTYPTVLAAVEMDTTGTTKIGKYVFDHSFIIPGLIHIILSVLCAFLFALMIVH